jgi:hypothetical protein
MSEADAPVVKFLLTLVVAAAFVRIVAPLFASDTPRRATTFEEPSLAGAVEVARPATSAEARSGGERGTHAGL